MWVDIYGYEGLYQINEIGEIKSLERKTENNRTTYKERILKQHLTKYGYYKVHLFKDGENKTFLVHRLVAEHFLSNPNHLTQVNHLDENKQNNHYKNLQWVSPKDNCNYGTRNERISKSKNKKVRQYDKKRKLLQEFESLTEASKLTGASLSHMSQVCNGQRKTCGGFIWKFTEDNE